MLFEHAIFPRRTSSARRCLKAPLKILIRREKQKFEIQIQILRKHIRGRNLEI